MAYDYSGLKTTAETLLARFGRTASLGVYSTAGDAWAPTVTYTATNVVALEIDDQTLVAMRGSGAIQQRLVSGASKTFMISTSAGVTPNAKDQITDGGTDYEVMEVKVLAPGDTTLLWFVDVKA